MQVNVVYRNDPERDLDDPVLEPNGRCFVARVYSGDYCDPFMDPDGWFGPKVPAILVRLKLSWMPFIAWKWPLLNRAGYIGFKRYGVDSENYRLALPTFDVYPGSKACHFSIRPFANIEKG